MQDNNRKRRANWSSAIGWLIFILVIAGGPLLNLLRGALGGVVNLPSNLLPMLIGGLVALSILVSVVRSLGGSRRGRGDTRLPTGNAPMPPFAGPAGPSLPPSVSLPRTAIARGGEQHLPDAPRFEPLINPKILAVGIVGALVLAGAALLLAGLALP
ncbi:MAG TPA: hypothetical protein VKE41_08220 [Roseiflexaceae bacterium]|nr:hypothetical protein [Roseiflexaceae bacterium]